MLNESKLAFSVSEVTALLGVHKNLVYRLINAGTIRSFRLGSKLLIPKSEIERLLSGEKETTPKGG